MYAHSFQIKGNDVARENARLYEKINSINKRKPKKKNTRRFGFKGAPTKYNMLQKEIDRLENNLVMMQMGKQLRKNKAASID